MSVPVSLRGPLRYGKAALRSPRSLLQPGQPQVSLPVLTGKVLQPWDRLCSLLLWSCFSSLCLSACLSCRAPGGAGQTRSRHGAAMEDARSSSAAEEEEEGLSPVWPQPHYKWQHTEAPWGTASSGPSLHPPVHLQLLLVSRGKYLAQTQAPRVPVAREAKLQRHVGCSATALCVPRAASWAREARSEIAASSSAFTQMSWGGGRKKIKRGVFAPVELF